MGLVQFLAPILQKSLGGYNSTGFYDFMIPLCIVVSLIMTILAIIGIAEKDRPEYWGISAKQEKVKISEYIAILKDNKELQRLMVAGAGCKLAFSIATGMPVLCMLYGGLMGNYDGLYLPMMVVGYVFSAPFFLLTVRTSQKHGQKASLMTYVSVALIMYIGVLAILLLWQQGNPAVTLSLLTGGKITINLYTIAFLLFFGIGYGAYYATADMPIPMVADCSDYETWRSGKYVPGIMGTLFSLVDKLVSSLGTAIVGVVVGFIGFTKALPDADVTYVPGMKGVVIILFCVVPMLAWIATLIAMKGYKLTGARMKKIQAVNAQRKDAIAGGMSLEEAMEKYQ
jgi:Na+/melibiose symporter-like transporter